MSLLLKILNFIKSAVAAFLGLTFFILLLAAVLLFSHSGNQLTISIAQQLEPRLAIELDQGSFFNSPSFSRISWLDQQTNIKIDAASYRFDWSCLFNKVCLQQLTISNAQIIIEAAGKTTDKKPEDADSSAFEFPIDVEIQAIDLNKINVSFEGTIVDLKTLHLQADAIKKDINLKSVIDGL